MTEVYTIGVYNSTEESYFDKLTAHNIDLFIDIRQRRGVRGSQYKYVNSNYLQAKLHDLDIDYWYIKELAPTNEIRQKQKDADKANGETKKQRTEIGEVFKTEYIRQILEPYDMEGLIQRIAEQGARRVVFFCVEEKATACHRLLVAERLAAALHCDVVNI